MPRSFLLTNRRYIPTPPPGVVLDDDDNNDNKEEVNVKESEEEEEEARMEIVDEETSAAFRPSTELMVAHILIRQAEQTEAVNLALEKPCKRPFTTTTTTHYHSLTPAPITPTTTITTTNNNSAVLISDSPNNSRDQYFHASVSSGPLSLTDGDGDFYTMPDTGTANPRPTVIYTVNNSNNNSNNNNHFVSSYSPAQLESGGSSSSSSNIRTCGDVGMDLSLKGDLRSPPPLTSTNAVTPEGEGQDKSALSDGDSDSGCSSQNEARSHLPPEVEYGWAECQAHFSLLYDLMTQGGRKLTGKENEQGAYSSKEDTEQAPYDYSHTPTREPPTQEPPVLYELMTESPRKASGRDVPEHAIEVEVSMQQYPVHHPTYQPQQQQQQQQQHPQVHLSAPKGYPAQQTQPHVPARGRYEDHRHATLQEVAQDRGMVHVSSPAPRYEPRRSLNDLLFAAGLPPVSPTSPTPLSPSSSPLSSEDVHACEECGKRYSTSSNLARHRQTHRSHGDKKARKCPHCDKVYVSMPAFSMHVRTHNQGCACPHCGKRFSRPWLLQGHIRTHTGEKPFACPQCGKSFADKSNLRAHIQTHSSEKPYVCGRCGKAFALKSYLYKHEESSCMRGERFRPLRRQVSAEC